MACLAAERNLEQQFDRQGFVLVPNAVTGEQIAQLNESIDHYQESYPDEWVDFPGSMTQSVNVLPRTGDFDFAIENPGTLNVLRRILGEEMTFEELSIMIRNPTRNVCDVKGWHRDLTRDFDRRREIDAVSLIYYLTDVTEADHCFSIIPESHNRLLDLRPEEVTPGMEFDVVAPAGTALLFHARCIHAGKLKPTSRQRRTLHLYYARSDQPRTSEWSDIPPRLAAKIDPRLPPRLFSKWNMTEVFDGTGKKPRDLPAHMSAAEMIRVVQQRANLPRLSHRPPIEKTCREGEPPCSPCTIQGQGSTAVIS
jgi:hypothetical protein